jgi:rhodanese-related sulfurtransferase
MVTVPTSRTVDSIDATTLAARLARGDAVVVLDVRRLEFGNPDHERIPGAIWLPHDEVPRRAQTLPSDRDVVVYCS